MVLRNQDQPLPMASGLRAKAPLPAAGLRRQRLWEASGIDMARHSRIGQRVRRILDARRNHRVVPRTFAVPGWAMMLMVLIPLALSEPRDGSETGGRRG
jgi:hypothetical protein